MSRRTPFAKKDQMEPGLKRAIRHFRLKMGLTQEECAAKAEMSQTRIWSDIERDRGRSKPLSILQLDDVGRVIGTTTSELIRKARELR